MLTYFPPLQPYQTQHLSVQSPHVLYVEECGNPNGIPVLFLHGGPGCGSGEDSRRLFDPNRYRIIIWDQRGCGRSMPNGELQYNHTTALLSDMEAIRQKLTIDRWLLFGHGWGATLALVYAQTYPQHVLGLMLGGLLLGRNQDRDWLYSEKGAGRVYPDHWQNFLTPVPKDQHHNALYEYYSLLTHENEFVHTPAALQWVAWEAHISKLIPEPLPVENRPAPHRALTLARLQCHYLINNYFLEPEQILRHMDRIKELPAILVHGRHDMVYPLENAWKLQQLWPAAELYTIPNAGHDYTESALLSAYVLATQKMSQRFHHSVETEHR